MLATNAAKKASAPQTGKVRSHPCTTPPNTPHRTSLTRRDELAPAIAVVMVCVVESGTPKIEAAIIVDDAALVAANPCHDLMLTMRFPMVAMMRQPPSDVPRPMVRPHSTMTHHGISNPF